MIAEAAAPMIDSTIEEEFQLNDMYLDYDAKKIEDFLAANNFVLIKALKFPFMQYEDRVYINKKY